ncbi:unnamed protein product [Arabidopsis halleri]
MKCFNLFVTKTNIYCDLLCFGCIIWTLIVTWKWKTHRSEDVNNDKNM